MISSNNNDDTSFDSKSDLVSISKHDMHRPKHAHLRSHLGHAYTLTCPTPALSWNQLTPTFCPTFAIEANQMVSLNFWASDRSFSNINLNSWPWRDDAMRSASSCPSSKNLTCRLKSSRSPVQSHFSLQALADTI